MALPPRMATAKDATVVVRFVIVAIVALIPLLYIIAKINTSPIYSTCVLDINSAYLISMDDFKIGDIVTSPHTKKRERYGNGMVIATKGKEEPIITVIFLMQDRTFFTHNFRQHELKLTEIDWAERRQIEQARDLHNSILNETFSI